MNAVQAYIGKFDDFWFHTSAWQHLSHQNHVSN